MHDSANIVALEEILRALGPALTQQMVFTGGSVVELYNEKGAAPKPRVTKDVDCIVRAATLLEYHKVEAELQKHGFINAGLVGEKGPTCRYVLGNILFDVMPIEGKVLGFSNQWFRFAVENPFERKLPSGAAIKLATFPRFLAAKLEALRDRGGSDLRGSHDLEDIVRLISGRKDPLREVEHEKTIIRTFIKESLRELFKNNTFSEAVDSSAPLGFREAQDVLNVLEKLCW